MLIINEQLAQPKDRKMSATICLLPQRGCHYPLEPSLPPPFPSPSHSNRPSYPARGQPARRRRPKCCLSSTLNFSSHCNCEMLWHFIFILFGQRSILSAISLAYFSPHFLFGGTNQRERRRNLLKICICPVCRPRLP